MQLPPVTFRFVIDCADDNAHVPAVVVSVVIVLPAPLSVNAPVLVFVSNVMVFAAAAKVKAPVLLLVTVL